jgi:hypothetical protein
MGMLLIGSGLNDGATPLEAKKRLQDSSTDTHNYSHSTRYGQIDKSLRNSILTSDCYSIRLCDSPGIRDLDCALLKSLLADGGCK